MIWVAPQAREISRSGGLETNIFTVARKPALPAAGGALAARESSPPRTGSRTKARTARAARIPTLPSTVKADRQL